ncbi:MAG TPA: hypothetical protein VHX39_03510, partial [Acetobacteraceae bacterium]|nr:hypothetical protein [Acetobacteraceae bacterium]
QWLQKRTAELLPAEYFHVAFTVPNEIASVTFYNLADAIEAHGLPSATDPGHPIPISETLCATSSKLSTWRVVDLLDRIRLSPGSAVGSLASARCGLPFAAFSNSWQHFPAVLRCSPSTHFSSPRICNMPFITQQRLSMTSD